MESKYKKMFSGKSALFVVIHVLNLEQVLRNALVASNEGASGIFLINHSGRSGYKKLAEIFYEVRSVYDSLWIGLNFLDLSSCEAVKNTPAEAGGLWTDDAGVTDFDGFDYSIAVENWDLRKEKKDWSGLYFGGVSFKYQKPISDHGLIAKLSCGYMDVVTTSGDATGCPPKVEKIIEMRNAIGDFPLAIASGINSDNVGQFLGIADCFLVSSSINSHFYDLDPMKVRDLVKVMGI